MSDVSSLAGAVGGGAANTSWAQSFISSLPGGSGTSGRTHFAEDDGAIDTFPKEALDELDDVLRRRSAWPRVAQRT
jgi:hypothetical protein